DGATRVAILQSSQVVDGRLARRLSSELNRPIDFFLSPSEAPEFGTYHAQPRLDLHCMPFVRFPNWYFCPPSRLLKRIPWNTPSGAEGLRCSNMERRVEGKGEPCGKLTKNRRTHLSPVRFATACENGHVMDFPWAQWAHYKSGGTCEPVGDGLYL